MRMRGRNDEVHPLIPDEGMNPVPELYGSQMVPVGKGRGQATAPVGGTACNSGRGAGAETWLAGISLMNAKGARELLRAISCRTSTRRVAYRVLISCFLPRTRR